MKAQLCNADCIEYMHYLIEQDITVDLVLTDPPYGTTARKWDAVIPFKSMWGCLNELITDKSIIALFSSQPFTSTLIASNLEMYRYSWVWDKGSASNFLNVNYAPLKVTEDINIFSNGKVGSLSKNPITYNPQGVREINEIKKNNPNSKWRESMGYNGNNKLNSETEYVQKYTNYPTNILKFPKDSERFHPTQKPVELLKYLIKTYTEEGDTVLDFTMGSGSTGVACVETHRDFIGIELNKEYYDIANKRVVNAKKQRKLV